MRVAIFAIFLTFVISCNFRQFWPIFVAVSGDLIGHFLYTSNLQKIAKKTAKFSAIFNENFAIRERCKGVQVHCVDLGESFPTSIYVQNLVSILPRTSLVKFARSPRTDVQIIIIITYYYRCPR